MNTNPYPQLNMPRCDLLTREVAGRTEAFDIVRRHYVALTPEEWVRQHVIHALHFQMRYPLELMQVEGSITLNEMTRRCDIVVYGRKAKPQMIVECKKPDVGITQKVVDQACRYNTVLKVPYLYLTNGMQHLILKVDFEKKRLVQLDSLPEWGGLEG